MNTVHEETEVEEAEKKNKFFIFWKQLNKYSGLAVLCLVALAVAYFTIGVTLIGAIIASTTAVVSAIFSLKE